MRLGRLRRLRRVPTRSRTEAVGDRSCFNVLLSSTLSDSGAETASRSRNLWTNVDLEDKK
jgi:hypothetical protein